MIRLRRASERGHTNLGWLDSRHTFSFGDYHDPDQMGFGHLRVLNEDRVEPKEGFGTHGHRDMEILSVVLSGSLEHKDSLGTGSVIRPGDVQWMSAGTGVTHSEFNPSSRAPVHFLQIWIVPDRTRLRPEYGQKSFPPEERQGRLCLVASRDGREGSLTIHQDASVYSTVLDKGRKVVHHPAAGRRAWVQVALGAVALNGEALEAGDGAAVSDEKSITLSGRGEGSSE
ncbi:MAG TPA: pirin family protein, partial [Candidatus Polarisedimenticolia bacterium]|nr:pirin family protein [Candidatus Polarisedimenticolia bacterium]